MTSGHNWQRVISNYTATGLWTEQEQSLFKQGIELYGTEWNKIAELVSTRTVEQTIVNCCQLCQEIPLLQTMSCNEKISTPSTL
eukprot:g8369.t1